MAIQVTPASSNSSPFGEGLYLALAQLSLFAQSPTLLERMRTIFGDSWDVEKARDLVSDLAAGHLPKIEVVDDLSGAKGAYAADNNTIYLSNSFLLANQNQSQAIADVLLEEIGHSIDQRLNIKDTVGDEGELFAALVNNRFLSASELARIQAENDSKTILVGGQLRSVEQATYGSINVDGNLTDWTSSERLDVAPGSGVAGYETYGKYAAGNYVFGIKSAVPIGPNTTIWIDADRNATTGFQIFGFAGGAEYNINIGADGRANLYSGSAGQTLIKALDYSISADGRGFEVAVAGTDLGTTAPAAINVLADVNDSVYLPGDYSRFQYSVAQAATAPKTVYGNITLDGTLTDWSAGDRLDFLPGSGQTGYAVYGKNTVDGYAFAINSAVAIGTNTTIWIDGDKNKTTGHQIFGFAGGAEYNINIASDGNAYLYSGGAGQNFIAKLDSKLSTDGKTLEVAVGNNRVAAGNGINVLADVNDTVFLPGDYNTTPYTVSNSITPTSGQTTYGNINLDGSLADWTGVDRLDYLTRSQQAGYQVFGKSTTDGYVFGFNSAVAVGTNTTIWLDTDKNASTGFQIFGPTTPLSVGAEYNINIASDGNAYLYSGGAGQNFIGKVDAKLSTDGKQWEVAINKSLLPVSATGINVVADINNTTFLPGDYTLAPLTVSGSALPVRTDLSKKVGIVYSETSYNKFFDQRAYNQLFTTAQNQAMQAGIPYDMLTEADLKDLSKVAQYDTLIFPSFNNVKAADVAAIENVLTQAVYKYGVGMVATGEFMTLDENSVALSGDPYQRLKNIFDVVRVGGAAPGANQVKIKDTSGGILSSSYTAGEVLKSYDNLALNAYAGLSKPGTVLAEQVVGGQSYNAVIATQTGGRNVHFSDASIFADSNLPWQGLEWSVYGDKATKARVGLDMTRNTSMFIARDDVDESRFTFDAPVTENKLADILTDWKSKYGFVGSHYINIGVDGSTPQGQQQIACCCPYCAGRTGEGTNWEVMRPIYQRMLALGNEIGTHSYTHPNFTSSLTPQQLEFEFNQSKLEIGQQLGITVTGAATPGNPENTQVHQELDKYFNYFSGVGTSFNNAFGFLTPNSKAVYFAPNLSFDFNLISFRQLTAIQAEAEWNKEFTQLTQHGNNPFLEFAYHDYGVTEKEPGYTRAMFDNFIAKAYNSGTEFITLEDAANRIRAFEKSSLTVNQVGDRITAQVSNATDIGKFAIDIDQPNKIIKNVTGYYAYDNDSVFTTKTGGTYTINLANTGTAADDVSRITSLAQRAELISVTGDGTNLSFSFNGEGKVLTDMKAIAATDRYKVTGADSYKITGDKIELTFNQNTSHTASITVGADAAPVVATPLTAVVETADAPATRLIDLSQLFRDVDGDAIVSSVVSNSNTNLLKTSITGNSLTLNYIPYEFGTTTITLRGTAAGKSVDTSFNVTVNPVSTIVNGTNNAETINGGASNEIIKGLLGNDRLNGNNGNDVLIGGGGNDSLFGGAGADVLLGANPTSATPGQGSYDVLQGDAGNDRYILGDVNAVYYNDGVSTNTGRSDYAAIIGFAAGDVIQLKGKAADYVLATGFAPNNGLQLGTLIQSNLFGQPELIGFVAGSTNLNLTSTAFAYV
jgi:Ca2+-binding RTX toxin-like protein